MTDRSWKAILAATALAIVLWVVGVVAWWAYLYTPTPVERRLMAEILRNPLGYLWTVSEVVAPAAFAAAGIAFLAWIAYLQHLHKSYDWENSPRVREFQDGDRDV